MGLAIDTILVDLHNTATTAAGLTAGTVTNSGDSLSVRSFKDGAYATLENVCVQCTTPPKRVRILSPRLHDNVTGLTWQALENPTEFLVAAELSQALYSADTLIVQLEAAASSDSLAALFVYYSDLPGVDANLKTWAQIENRIINIKPIEVDCTSSGTIGTWVDTAVNTTDTQLKANYEYAVLGFTESANLACVAVKGPATGNLRIGCPAASPTLRLTDYFIFQSQQGNRPYIPVFNANDRAATYVSVAANTASVTSNVYMVCAQLAP